MKSSTRYRLLGELPALNAGRKNDSATPAEAVAQRAARRPGSATAGPRRVPKRRSKRPTHASADGEPGGGSGSGGGDGPVLEENVPKELLCAINQHIMRRPLRSPHGFVFEAETILEWLDEHGQVCPMSGAPLTSEDLVPDGILRMRIQEHHVRAALTNQARVDDESDPYAFD